MIITLKRSQVYLKLIKLLIKLIKLAFTGQNVFVFHQKRVIKFFSTLIELSGKVYKHVLNLGWIEMLKIVARINFVGTIILLIVLTLLFIINRL